MNNPELFGEQGPSTEPALTAQMQTATPDLFDEQGPSNDLAPSHEPDPSNEPGPPLQVSVLFKSFKREDYVRPDEPADPAQKTGVLCDKECDRHAVAIDSATISMLRPWTLMNAATKAFGLAIEDLEDTTVRCLAPDISLITCGDKLRGDRIRPGFRYLLKSAVEREHESIDQFRVHLVVEMLFSYNEWSRYNNNMDRGGGDPDEHPNNPLRTCWDTLEGSLMRMNKQDAMNLSVGEFQEKFNKVAATERNERPD